MTAEVLQEYPVKPPADVPPALVRVWRCNFCANGLHGSCPGAIRNGKKQLVLCYCCRLDPRCLDCGYDRDVDSKAWVCLFPAECQGRIQRRLENSPLWNQLQQCRVDSVVRGRAIRETAARLREQVGQEPDEFDRPLERKPRTPRSTVGACECCGAATKGGKFLPGHDARLKSRLRSAAKSGDGDAKTELERRGW